MNRPDAGGKLFLVGIGPGSLDYLTPAAQVALQSSNVVVAYRAYLELIARLLPGRELVAMELGQEMERAARAVHLACAGRTVSVVSSGDSGIYGMAGPVFSVLTHQGWDGRSPEVETIPGVSAMQAAASLLGAPLMQDFCAISLSDLLTPWETIRRRVEAAALGDFVIAFYNPRSRRRTWQLPEARLILLEHRPGTTPVGLVRNAGRPGQQVTMTDLDGLEGLCQGIDMVTIVLVGNSGSYAYQNRLITPRGYEAKSQPCGRDGYETCVTNKDIQENRDGR